ncbi:hypothetical protein PQ478_09185 [Alkalihalophilus pseudofirmus]|uniref:hypothetical protein n=1 Tax=Alkalihalophilus pseudofirmus TaxID=79885 RepID=UPI00259B56D5|nr:hypothetical protein [Alkalihalophilus pseudofirmus]WEG18642.1 hypothetical protein PQ478_09185 [Alkalihalophilus pseudofirmus]
MNLDSVDLKQLDNVSIMLWNEMNKEIRRNGYSDLTLNLEDASRTINTIIKGEINMNYYEFNTPYYALIKALTIGEAVDKYIESVAGSEEEYDELLEECKLVKDYIAITKFARSKGENGELMEQSEIFEVLGSEDVELLLVDGSLL